jgi:hypothetical protein
MTTAALGVALGYCASSARAARETRVVFEAESRTTAAPNVVLTRAAIRNAGSDTIALEISAHCPILTRFYADSLRMRQPVWDGLDRVCFLATKTIHLGPGAAASFTRTDTIPGEPGTARLFASTVFEMPRNRLEIPSGTIALRFRPAR